MSDFRHNKRIWKFLRRALSLWLKRKFNYSPEICQVGGPLLVLANHNTDWDPLLLGMAFPEYMSFVASEHIFRWGFVSKLLNYLFAPISRFKGATADTTALTIVRRLKQGTSVAMFAEGNRSFTGITGEILPATGKLARISGATLVTYSFKGGYFTSPRWCGSKLRKGKLVGSVVNVYPPEKLRSMGVDEINAAIAKDLHVDAYEDQRSDMVPFKGKALAEGLERVLCLCPKCGDLDTLRSNGNKLECKCGFSAIYNEFGFFEGENLPYNTVTEWDEAQTAQLIARFDAGELILKDDEMTLKEIMPDHGVRLVGRGSIALFADRLECCGETFDLNAMGGFSLHGPQTIDLSCGGKSYEISSDKMRCTRKYLVIYNHLKQERNRPA